MNPPEDRPETEVLAEFGTQLRQLGERRRAGCRKAGMCWCESRKHKSAKGNPEE
ncbi:hypothetical protein [Novosphingobium lindaniclasticum]